MHFNSQDIWNLLRDEMHDGNYWRIFCKHIFRDWSLWTYFAVGRLNIGSIIIISLLWSLVLKLHSYATTAIPRKRNPWYSTTQPVIFHQEGTRQWLCETWPHQPEYSMSLFFPSQNSVTYLWNYIFFNHTIHHKFIKLSFTAQFRAKSRESTEAFPERGFIQSVYYKIGPMKNLREIILHLSSFKYFN